jgi:signal transduction histidine kinase
MSGTGEPDGHDVPRSLARQSLLVALVCVGTDAVSFLTRGPAGFGFEHALLLAGIVVIDACLALHPRYSGWVVLAHGILGSMLATVMPGRNVGLAGQLVAGYRAGAWLRDRPGVTSLLTLIAGVLSSLWIGGFSDPYILLSLTAANAVLPWLVGRSTTARKAYVDELRHRREDAVKDAQAELERAVTREREVIAGDLHDVISHHVSAIGVHAGAARLNLSAAKLPCERKTESVGASLAAVESSSRAAMVDLRRLLGLLYNDGESASQPGLDKLDELFEGVRTSGLEVVFAVYGPPRPIAQSKDIALYRMAQEMLTNALKHGDGSPIRVELDYRDDDIVLTSRNRIAATQRTSLTAQYGSGRGLENIRARARIFGGEVDHSPGDGQFWHISVTIPTGETR